LSPRLLQKLFFWQKHERHENIRAGRQHNRQPAGFEKWAHILFFGSSFAQCQTRAMADVQDVNFTFAHSKQDSVFVLAATVKNLADFHIEKLVFRSERTAFWKNLQ
jgi:hypothetical protein